jgi:hypothetical protein
MKRMKKLGLLFPVAVIITLAISAIGIQPAQANPTVTLPTGANGTNGNPDLMAYACGAIGATPGFVDVFAPAPVDPNGLSFADPLQKGRFSWQLSYEGQSAQENDPRFFASSRTLRVPIAAGDLPEDEITLTVTGRISSGPAGVNYQNTDFTFKTIVIDPTFTSGGSGTVSNPWIITSAAELEKVRCHQDKFFALGNDIELEKNWFPIGSSSDPWRGAIDGRGYTISGLEAEYPTMSEVGLFGAVRDSFFQNLNIVSPKVRGLENVGVIAGTTQYAVGVQNVRIVDATVTGQNRLGLLIGDKKEGGLVHRTSVEGSIQANPVVYKFNGFDVPNGGVNAPQRIGGMVGKDWGESSAHLENTVSVDINVFSPINYVAKANSYTPSIVLGGYPRINDIGGYIGSTDEDSSFRYLDVQSSIRIESFSLVEYIGGVAGRSESPWSELNVDTSIEIVLFAGEMVDRIGGVIGYADEDFVSSVQSSSRILIESANQTNGSLQTNNSLDLNYVGAGVAVSRVGGVTGQIDQTSHDTFIRSDTDITIRNVKTIERVAGYVGLYGNSSRNGVGYSDTFVSGSIALQASETIRRVGGYSNLINNGQLNGARMFAAVSITTDALNVEHSTVNPFLGELGTPAIQRPFGAYWDSNLNGSSNPEGYPGQTATTSQLQSRSFLEGTGMDMTNVWTLKGGYPVLCESMYTFAYRGAACNSGSSSTQIAAGGGSPKISSLSSQVNPGQMVTIQGSNLRFTTGVLLGDRLVTYTVRKDGSIQFRVPKSLSGQVVLAIQNSLSSISDSKVIRVVANSKRLSRTFDGFLGDSPELTEGIKTSIKEFVRKLSNPVSLVCVGSTSNAVATAFDRTLATQRANRACDLAKTQYPRLKTSIRIEPASGVSASARNVRLILKGN